MTPTHPTLTISVRSQSSREGGRPKLIVLHTTEGGDSPSGNADLKGLASFFDGAEASAHVANNVDGHDVRMVADAQKSWAVCNLNPYSLSIEQISFSAFSKEEWFKRDAQLQNTARWVAYWSRKWDIPIRRGMAPNGVILRSGVVQHKNLGAAGCGHSDCGDGYPIRYVRLLARYYAASAAGNHGQAKRLRGRVNRIRKHYGLAAL